MFDDLSDDELLANLPKRKREKLTARSYIEEQVQPFLSKFNWENETLEHDMKAFWVAIHRLWKNKPTYFRESLEFGAKNNLHPLAFVKMVNTILKK